MLFRRLVVLLCLVTAGVAVPSQAGVGEICRRGWIWVRGGAKPATLERMALLFPGMPREMVWRLAAVRDLGSDSDHLAFAASVEGWLKAKGLKTEVGFHQDYGWYVKVLPDAASPHWLGRMASQLDARGVGISFLTRDAAQGGIGSNVALWSGKALIGLPLENLFTEALNALGGHEVQHARTNNARQRDWLDLRPQVGAVYQLTPPGKAAGEYEVVRLTDEGCEVRRVGESAVVPLTLLEFVHRPHRALRFNGRSFFSTDAPPKLKFFNGEYAGYAGHSLEESLLTYRQQIRRQVAEATKALEKARQAGDKAGEAAALRGFANVRIACEIAKSLTDADAASLRHVLESPQATVQVMPSTTWYDREIRWPGGRIQFDASQINYRQVVLNKKSPDTDWSLDVAAVKEVLRGQQQELAAADKERREVEAEIDRVLRDNVNK